MKSFFLFQIFCFRQWIESEQYYYQTEANYKLFLKIKFEP